MNLKNIQFTAGRLAGTNKRQKLINFARIFALLSVMLGSMALIISLSVLDGFETMLSEKAVKFTSHITINSATGELLPKSNIIIDVLPETFEEIESVAPVVRREGLIRSKTFIEGIIIRGMKDEYDLTGMKDNIIEGSMEFSSDNAHELVLGQRLARKLGVGINDTVVLFALNEGNADSDYFPEIDNYIVKGIYRTGMVKYDDIMVYIPYENSFKLFNMVPNTVSSYEVMTKNLENVGPLARKIESYLEMPYYCSTVYQLHSSIFAWIELQKAPIPIVLGLISIVAVFNIITILLITVVEKTHSIGILRTLGMKNREIISIFLFQGVRIGAMGTLLGCGLGLLFGILQNEFGLIQLKGEIYFLDSLPVEFAFWHYAVVIGISLLLSFLATLIPSMIAVKITPIRAIRFK